MADRSNGHWVPLNDGDCDLIANGQLSVNDFALCLALWYILVREASYRRELSFVMTDGILAKRANVNRKTVMRVMPFLEATGLVESKTYPVKGNCMTPTKRTIHPSTPPWREANPACSETGQPLSTKRTRGCPVVKTQKRTDSYIPALAGIGKKRTSATLPSASALGARAGESRDKTTTAVVAPAKPAPLAAAMVAVRMPSGGVAFFRAGAKLPEGARLMESTP